MFIESYKLQHREKIYPNANPAHGQARRVNAIAIRFGRDVANKMIADGHIQEHAPQIFIKNVIRLGQLTRNNHETLARVLEESDPNNALNKELASVKGN